ncbi:carbonic anhydrase [Sheuella amnicola]|uniref:carbonic anhydrase n=1 Tax=Sheuella amnicola TaxID=2707330 RepID=UPI00288350C7|nr:carbonic anhydrase [Sheuella amnicola]
MNTDILASLEYGVAVLNAPLIMVLGHTSCGAINAASVIKLKESNPIISERVSQGKLKIVGGLYDLQTGRVSLIA